MDTPLSSGLFPEIASAGSPSQAAFLPILPPTLAGASHTPNLTPTLAGYTNTTKKRPTNPLAVIGTSSSATTSSIGPRLPSNTPSNVTTQSSSPAPSAAPPCPPNCIASAQQNNPIPSRAESFTATLIPDDEFGRPSSAMPLHRSTRPKPKCSMPLLPVFIGPVLVLTAIAAVLIWMTSNTTATNSVDAIAGRLHDLLHQHLDSRIRLLVHEMSLCARFLAAEISGEEKVEEIQRFMYLSMRSMAGEPLYMFYATTDGHSITAKVSTGGEVLVGERLPSVGNISYWHMSPNGTRGAQVSTSPLNPLTRPWYKVVADNHFHPTFTPPYMHLTENLMGLSLGLPVYDEKYALQGVVAVDFSITSIEHALKETYDTLQTTGVLMLYDESTETFLASAGSAAISSRPAEMSAIAKKIMAAEVPGGGTVMKQDLPNLGSCFTMAISISGTVSDGFHADGLSWKLLVAIPQKDYYQSLWTNNNINAGILSVWAVVFLIVKAAIFQILLAMPLRNLRKKLIQLKESANTQNFAVVGKETTSFFTEVQGLQLAAFDALVAVEEVSRLRSQELAISAEAARAKEHAEALMKSKEMFFAMMSHEMRTPLTACIGMAQILLETTTLDQRQRECAQAIEGSGNTLLTLINDLLDLSKLEADKIALEHIAFSIRDCIEQSVSIVQSKAEEKGLELIAFISCNVPGSYIGDSCRLRQVLLNLLSNAIKFTTKGTISVNCTVTPSCTAIHFEVVDTGIGINAQAIERLFQPFTQADASTTRKFGGTGLGLSISQKLVQMMGGTLQIDSDGEGHGSRFWFELPLPSESCDTIENMAARPVSRLSNDSRANPSAKVLVIDHLPARRAALCEQLRVLQVPFDTLNSIADLNESHADNDVALIHNTEGFYRSAQFKKLRTAGLKAAGSSRQVMLITRMKDAASGLDDDVVCVTKPVTVRKLKNALLDVLHMFPAPSVGTLRSPVLTNTPGNHDLLILIVDDVALNQRVLMLKLQQFGFSRIEVASSGLEAVELVRRNISTFDLIFMDVMMPDMDGYEATRRIKVDTRYADVPIIGITGISDPNVNLKCSECGMAGVLAKPFDTDKLIQLVNKHTHLTHPTFAGPGPGTHALTQHRLTIPKVLSYPPVTTTAEDVLPVSSVSDNNHFPTVGSL